MSFSLSYCTKCGSTRSTLLERTNTVRFPLTPCFPLSESSLFRVGATGQKLTDEEARKILELQEKKEQEKGKKVKAVAGEKKEQTKAVAEKETKKDK